MRNVLLKVPLDKLDRALVQVHWAADIIIEGNKIATYMGGMSFDGAFKIQVSSHEIAVHWEEAKIKTNVSHR